MIAGTTKNIPISVNNLYPTTLKASSTGRTSYILPAQNIKIGMPVQVSITVLKIAPAGLATVSLYFAGVTKNIIINIIPIIKASITIPNIGIISNNITETILINYNNGRDILANTTITILNIEPRGLQANITSTTANNFVVSVYPNRSYVGMVSITISVLNTAGQTTATLVLNLVAPPSITFAEYNHLITHSSSVKQIPFTNLVGTIQSVSITTPSSYSVITNLAVIGSNIQFNTKGRADTEHIIVTVLNVGATITVQLSVQVMQESIANFNTGIIASNISNYSYNVRKKNAAYGDVDGDVDLDIVIPVHGGANVIYKNNGDGTFVSSRFGDNNNTHHIGIGDLDGDGDLDLLVANRGNQNNYYYINDGRGSFTANRFRTTQDTQEVVIGDIDNDGDLDGYFVNWNQRNVLQINDGNANFTSKEISSDVKNSTSVDFGDVDNDGDLDIYVGNSSWAINELLINNGNYSFDSIMMNSSSRGDHGRTHTNGVKFADLNNDNKLDLYVANGGNQQNRIYIGDGLGVFTANKDITGDLGESGDVNISDVNKDGFLDIYVANSGQQNKLWLGTGGSDFITNNINGDINSKGGIIADFNGDGALDLFSNKQNQPNKLYLSRSVIINATPSIVIQVSASKSILVSFNNLYPATLTSLSIGQISYELSATQNIKNRHICYSNY